VPALDEHDFPCYNGFLDYLLGWIIMPFYGALATLFLKFSPSPYPFRFDFVTPSNLDLLLILYLPLFLACMGNGTYSPL
jgi:hypothetical protein